MKKASLLLVVLFVVIASVAQQRVPVPSALSEKMSHKSFVSADDNLNPMPGFLWSEASVGFAEDLLGGTIYDLQSNSCSPFGRLIMFDDGTISAVWTRGTGPTAYSNRGTGYNYFDGTSWGPEPTARIETVRTGWPSVAQLGETGEVVLAHGATGGLVFNKRMTKGSGAWSQSILPLPSGVNTTWWSRMITGGEQRNTIHAIVLTLPTGNGGVVYEGMDGAMLYYRSTDGGTTWDKDGVILPGMTSAEYAGFGADSYAWAEPQGNTIAFVVCDPQNDMFIMKSTDNGDTWQKSIIWEQPYPHLNNGVETDTLWGPDGSASLAFDKNGKLHLAFGTYRLKFTSTGYTFWPGLSGITYWNEDMPTFTGGDQMNILNIDSLDAKGLQIGYYNLDWNGNGELDILDGGGYNTGWACWPQLAFDDQDNAIFIYSALMENFDNGTQNYRHILSRASSNNGTFWGTIIDLSDDPVHMFDECAWPVICNKSDPFNWYFIYQYDNEPGTTLGQDEDPPGDNFINFYHLLLMGPSIGELPGYSIASVSPAYPNPSSDQASINVTLVQPVQVSITISDVTSRQVSNTQYGTLNAGVHKVVLDMASLRNGIYLLTVTAGQQQFTQKLIVR